MDKRKVVVFDSGVGGLTTLKYLSEMLPGEDYYYFGDYDNNPYGTKSTKELQEILRKNIKYLSSLNPKIIVIACNTAGTQIEYLKTITDILMYEPISVTADYIKNNLKMKKESNILLLATDFTVKTGLYEQKLSEYNKKKDTEIKNLQDKYKQQLQNIPSVKSVCLCILVRLTINCVKSGKKQSLMSMFPKRKLISMNKGKPYMMISRK